MIAHTLILSEVEAVNRSCPVSLVRKGVLRASEL